MLADGDFEIIDALFSYRYLTSGQLARLTGRSSAVIRRRVRKHLVPMGLVDEMPRRPTQKAAYCLGKGGFEAKGEELGVPVSQLPFSAPKKVKGFFWQHDLLTNDVRISLSNACQAEGSPVVLHEVIPEWELVQPLQPGAPHHKRYRLSEMWESDWGRIVHRPDCMFLVAPSDSPDSKVAVFLEADRNTEDMRRIRQKVEGYNEYRKRELFRSSFGATGMRVLFVLGNTKSERRIASMQREIVRLAEEWSPQGLSDLFRFTRAEELSEETILGAPIWCDAQGNERFFFQPKKATAAE